MSSLNLCQFIGRVGKIETRYSANGEAITNISLAVNESWKDKATGEKKENTEWVKVSFFGKLAEIAEKYVHKPDLIYVSGSIRTRKYQNKEGIDVYATEIRGDRMQMLGGPSDEQMRNRKAAHDISEQGGLRGGSTATTYDDIPF